MKEGKGLFLLASGASYEGGFHQDRPHGKGSQMWPDGTEYYGEWINGNKVGYNVGVGFGVMRWPDGERYEGDW